VINALQKTETSQIKDIGDPAEKTKMLLESIQLTQAYDFSSKNLLLVDDLFDSGRTLSICTSVLKNKAHAEKVCVLTMTKTRS
jgi:competence protein ComFC